MNSQKDQWKKKPCAEALHQVEADLLSEASILAVVRGDDAKTDRSTGRRDDSEPQQVRC